MANTASTNNRNVNEIAKFKFFKKRRQNLHAHGPSDSSKFILKFSFIQCATLSEFLTWSKFKC